MTCCPAAATARGDSGQDNPPAGFNLPEGSHYNRYFPGHAIKMPKPLNDGQVTYDDGSPTTVAQYAHDVTTFLMWAAEPHMEARKEMGFKVMLYLIVLSLLLYFTKKKIWARVGGEVEGHATPPMTHNP